MDSIRESIDIRYHPAELHHAPDSQSLSSNTVSTATSKTSEQSEHVRSVAG